MTRRIGNRVGMLWLVAAIATGLVGIVIAGNLARTNHDAVDLLMPGGLGPSAGVVRHDFPQKHLNENDVGSDGQQFYAIARDPLHPRAAARYLDRPQYRLHRVLYPALAALVVVGNNGKALVFGLLGVNLLGVFLGCVALGALAVRLGRPPAYGAAFAVLPGVLVSVRMSAADALALALALGACVLIGDRRPAIAAILAALAVLTKESSYLVVAPVAVAYWWRHRVDVRLVLLMPAVVAAAWWAVVRVAVPVDRGQYVEFAPPLIGLAQAWPYWWHVEPGAGVLVLLGIAMAVVALVRAPRGAYAAAIAVQLGFITLLSKPTFQFLVSGPRTVLPVMALAVLALAERKDVACA